MEEAAFLVAVQRIVSGMFGATLLLTFKTTGWRVNRIEGATLLAGYVGYLARAATVVA